MNTLSFMTANFVARPLGYHMTKGWGEGDRAVNDHFRPLATYGERFEEILRDIVAMGFHAVDLWLSHLNYTWATAEHIAIARDLLAKYELSVSSVAGWFGATAAELEACCRIARALGAPILGGSLSILEKDRMATLRLLEAYDLRLGLENHPEKTPAVLLERIGDGGNGHIGACIDTGWFGTQGYNAAQAITALADCLFHVHLKDVLAPSQPNEHHTCLYGQGIVPIDECLNALQAIGYQGGISIEHEPELYDPTADCIAGLKLVQARLRPA